MDTNSDGVLITPDPLLPLPEVLALIGVAPSTWWAGVASGKFPPPVKCGRRSFWPQSVIAAYIETLKQPQGPPIMIDNLDMGKGKTLPPPIEPMRLPEGFTLTAVEPRMLQWECYQTFWRCMYKGREESMHTEATAWAEKMRGRGLVIRYAEGYNHWKYGDGDTDLLPLDGRFTYTTAPRGQKNPNIKGWNKRENCIYKPEDGVLLSGKNVGLVHAYCDPPTMCLDIDDWEGAEKYMEKEMGICSHKHLLCSPLSSYRSGRDNSVKVLWTMPKDVGVLPTAVVKAKDGHVLFEYRCGTHTGKSAVDLLPPSLHPSGTTYAWDCEGHNLSNVDEIPEYFLDHWRGLLQAGKPVTERTNEKAHRGYNREETPNKLALLRVMLRHVSADCCRDDWKRIVFSILSSGYSAAEAIAYDWSITSDRYTEEDFNNLVRDYINGVTGTDGAITLGTVYHYAREGGWNG